MHKGAEQRINEAAEERDSASPRAGQTILNSQASFLRQQNAAPLGYALLASCWALVGLQAKERPLQNLFGLRQLAESPHSLRHRWRWMPDDTAAL